MNFPRKTGRWVALALAVVLWVPLVAEDAYRTRLNAVVALLYDGSLATFFSVTNELERLVEDAPTPADAATCRILWAWNLLDQAGTMADADAFTRATNLCAVARREMQDRTREWQFYGAQLVESGAFALEGKRERAYSVATNMIAVLDAQTGDVTVDTNAWRTIAQSARIGDASLRETLCTYAAATSLMQDKTRDISSYTNGLPPRAIGVLHEMFGN